MKHKFKLPTTDRLLGISAMIISILTLLIFIFQTHIMYKKSKLSVKPSLFFDAEYQEIDSVTISYTETVTNKGLGPAIIQDSKLSYQNEDYLLDFDDFIKKKFPDIKYADLDTDRIEKGDIIAVNETITIYKIQTTEEIWLKLLKYVNFEDLHFELIYSSMYEDEKWSENND